MNAISINGNSLVYSQRGNGRPLVLVHGFPLDGTTWDDVAARLEGEHEVIVPNLRGFGGSTAPTSFYSMADMADDLAGLLDHLGHSKVALAGHSMGGYVALAFAKKYAARVAALTLVSSQAAADNEERKAGRYKTAEDVAQKGVAVVVEAMAPKLSADPKLQAYARELIARQSAGGVVGALKAMAEREDLTGVLKAAGFPLTLVHGDADALIPIDRAREIKALNPSALLIEFAGVGHLPMKEAVEQTATALESMTQSKM